MSQLQTPESEAFLEHRDDLIAGIQDPAELAGKLYSRKIISAGIRAKVENEMIDRLSRCRVLIAAVECKLASNPNSFHKFVAVLKEEPTFEVIAKRLSKSYKRYKGIRKGELTAVLFYLSHFQSQAIHMYNTLWASSDSPQNKSQLQLYHSRPN